jgi:hypothetical protein
MHTVKVSKSQESQQFQPQVWIPLSLSGETDGMTNECIASDVSESLVLVQQQHKSTDGCEMVDMKDRFSMGELRDWLGEALAEMFASPESRHRLADALEVLLPDPSPDIPAKEVESISKACKMVISEAHPSSHMSVAKDVPLAESVTISQSEICEDDVPVGSLASEKSQAQQWLEGGFDYQANDAMRGGMEEVRSGMRAIREALQTCQAPLSNSASVSSLSAYREFRNELQPLLSEADAFLESQLAQYHKHEL